MKILWLTIDRSMRVTGHFDYFREAVSKLVEVKPVFKSTKPYLAGKFSKLAMKRLIKPEKLITKKLASKGWDFVMIDALFAYMDDNLDYLKVPKAMVIEDNHDVVPWWQVAQGKERGVKILFHRGYESFHRFHPSARENYKCCWLPFAANTAIFKPLELKRSGVLQAGMMGEKHYPLRIKLYNLLKDWNEYTYIPRPKESIEKTYKWPVREDFANVINQAEIFLTCGSRYDAAVQKYFEVPACKTVLMSNWFKDLDKLGFENGRNIAIYEEDVRSQLENMLDNKERLKRIAEAGYELIHERHTLEIRAREFLETVKEIIGEGR